jgi:hypothetical protein
VGGAVVGLALAVATAAIAVLLLAVNRRWFARFTHGFLVSLVVALAATGLAIVAVLGVWAYVEGRDTLQRQIVRELTHIAEIQRNEIKEDLDTARAQLQTLAARLGIEAQRNPAAVRERLQGLQAFDPRYLQVNLMDAEGRILVSSSLGPDPEPPNRVGVAHTLEGRVFVSDVYRSPVFKRWVLFLAAPVKDGQGRVTGAMSVCFDMQEDLMTFVRAARFGGTGYTVITNGEGRILAHPDPARIGENVTGSSVVRDALKGQTTSAIVVNAAGREMLMVGRPFASPSTEQARPWVLLAEAATTEVLTPLRELREEFGLALVAAVAACVVIAGLLARSGHPAAAPPARDRAGRARRRPHRAYRRHRPRRDRAHGRRAQRDGQGRGRSRSHQGHLRPLRHHSGLAGAA